MTPKEKARQMVLSMSNNIGLNAKSSSDQCIFEAKKCALITVDEILNIDNIKQYILHKEIIEFYKEVKQQIELL